MATPQGNNGFNNLSFSTKRVAIAEKLEHLAGHNPLDLSFKEPSIINEVLTASTSQLNGKYGDLKYKPVSIGNMPNRNYDAGFDPTILNAVRNKYVDVSGTLIPSKELRTKNDINVSRNPLIPIGRIE